MERAVRTQATYEEPDDLDGDGSPDNDLDDNKNGGGEDAGDKTKASNDKAKAVVEKSKTVVDKTKMVVDKTKTGDRAINETTKENNHRGRSNGLAAKENDEERKRNGQVEEKTGQPGSRVRPSLSKMKLLQRSHAMREETSPPPDPESHQHTPQHPPSSSPTNTVAASSPHKLSTNHNNNNNTLSVRPRHKLSRQGSSRDSVDTASPCLSRENSTEQYTDFTGTDLEHFIMETINKNHKDRTLMLQIEQQLVNYIRERPPLRQYYKFPAMSSYQRMLVHRVAAYFGMEHNVDQPGNCVVVGRTKGTRVPDIEFKEYVKEDLLFPEEPRRSILKRDSSSFDDGGFKSPERHYSSECRRSKSFEEREEEYEKARRRIFTKSCDESGNDNGGYMRNHGSLHDGSRRSSPDDIRWPGDIQPWSSSESDPAGTRHSRNNNHLRADNRSARLLKVESFEGGDTLKAGSLRSSVSKSYSFGGYSGSAGQRCDNGAGNRVLTKQDSGSSMSSRISPGSSSGYKSQSQRSDATMSATPSPTATPHSHGHHHHHGGGGHNHHGGGHNHHHHSHHSSSQLLSPSGGGDTLMWAVTDMAAVPPGSLLINPQTGQPYTNPDGSVYRYDPANPLKSTPEESKSVSTQMTPVPSLPPSPAKSVTAIHPSKNTTTTSTSPSFPVTPPPPSDPPPQPPPTASVASAAPPSYQSSYHPDHQPLNASVANASQLVAMPMNPHASQNMMGSYQQQQAMYPGIAQQVDPSVLYANPPLQCHSQPQGPMVYTQGYNMVPPYDQRQPMAPDMRFMWLPNPFPFPDYTEMHGDCPYNACGGSCYYDKDGCTMMTDLSGYFMGMNMVSDQQRGAGDTNNQSQLSIAYQPQQPQPNTAQPNNYWQQQQPQAGMPMYYTIPHPGATPMLTSSPPQPMQQQQPPSAGSNQSSPRYVTYPPVGAASAYQSQQPAQQAQDSRQPHNGGFMGPCAYPLPGYATAPLPGPPQLVNSSGGDCLPPPATATMVYGPPAPGGTSTAMPYFGPSPVAQQPNVCPPGQQQQPYNSGQGPSFRAPTPPQTPNHAQPMCPSYVFLNGSATGGGGYPSAAAAVYNSGSGGVVGGVGPTTPQGVPTQFVPVMPNIGLFRPTMQMMRSSPPPRPPREGAAGSKPPYSRSPSVNSNKERGHYDSADKMIRYPSMPMFRMMPGDMRGLVGTPLQGSLRMQFPLPPTHPNHRGPHPNNFSTDNRARKPRPKGPPHVPYNQQPRGPQPNHGSHTTVAPRSNSDTGRTVTLPPKHH